MEIGVKEIKAIYVYEILLNADRSLTRREIAYKLDYVYGVKVCLRTLTDFLRAMIAAGLIKAETQKHDKKSNNQEENNDSADINNIDDINDIDDDYYDVDEYGIKKLKRTNYSIKERPLEDSELLWLIDNAIFSKQLSETESNSIVSKLLRLGSKKLKDKVRFLGDNKHYFHASNDDISNNINALSDAIKENKSVVFTPLEYGIDLKLHSSLDEKCCIKPIRMIPINDFYYVIAFEPKSNSLQHYRVDLMKDIKKSKENIDYDSFNKKININDYLSTHSLMRSGDSKFTKLKLPQEQIGLVIDRFGTNIQCAPEGDTDIIVTLRSNPDDLYVWALENGDFVEVLEPQSVRNRIRTTVTEMYKKYSCTDIDEYHIALERTKSPLFRLRGAFKCPNIKLDDKPEWKNLTNLRCLHLINNRVSDYTFLSRFKKLHVIIIENDRINDLSFVLQVPQLTSLRLIDTTVSDISCLSKLNLYSLQLIGNYDIQDYSVLEEIKSLKKLYIDYETLENIEIDELKKCNPELEITLRTQTREEIKL